jgi:hypothetical protein
MKKVDLNRKVYNKDRFNKSIDTEFNEIIPPSDDVEVAPIDVGTFFQNYAEIFYDIPKTGDVNSHEFLIKQSTDYVGGDAINADILALLQEINSLRQELFDLEERRLRELAEDAESAVGLNNNE